jgi:hemoglobin
VSAESDPPTIYEWGGGREAFERWLNLFYDLVEQDGLVGPVFGGTVGPEHRDHATTWWCEVMGGPAEYTEQHGGYEHMLHRHIGLNITPEQRLQFVTLLSEWGTRLAQDNSQPGAAVVEQAPVPRWGWGVAPPYQP